MFYWKRLDGSLMSAFNTALYFPFSRSAYSTQSSSAAGSALLFIDCYFVPDLKSSSLFCRTSVCVKPFNTVVSQSPTVP
jgi:hypothetical protein